MTTTAVFAEILAIGIQTVLVLGVALAALVDLGPFASGLENWTALTTIAIVAIAYVLGVVVDRLADSLMGAISARRTRLRPRANRRAGAGSPSGGRSEPSRLDFARARRRVLEASSPLANFLEYQRSRMRLMRGTVLNLILAIPVLNLALTSFLASPGVAVYVGANAVLAAGIAACWYAHMEIRTAQDRWLQSLLNDPASVQATESGSR